MLLISFLLCSVANARSSLQAHKSFVVKNWKGKIEEIASSADDTSVEFKTEEADVLAAQIEEQATVVQTEDTPTEQANAIEEASEDEELVEQMDLEISDESEQPEDEERIETLTDYLPSTPSGEVFE